MRLPGVVMGICALLAIAFAIVAPNLIWFDRSSVDIRNFTEVPLTDVELRFCGSSTRIPELGAGQTRLLFLPKCQKAVLIVSAGTGAGAFEACKREVESSLHHVEITVTGPRTAACELGSPPYTPLLLEKAIRSVL